MMSNFSMHQGVSGPFGSRTTASGKERGVALLDFEGDEGECANASAEDKRSGCVGDIDLDASAISGVRFTLGIPFALNHADVGALPSPLNVPTMFWSWQGGA